MKEILAVIRMNMMNPTKKALTECGAVSMTARKVIGRGKGKVDYMLLKGAEAGYDEAINQLSAGPKLIPKRMLTLVVPDDKVDGVVKTIMEVNKTGNPGDGKIFVMPVFDAIRVRTGETGDEALDEFGAESAT
jgi:nitrogen regulatory protein PII 2